MSVNRLYAAAIVTLFGCAATAANPSSHRLSTLLTAVEMAEKHADLNTAYDAVARLRPNWLAAHGTTSFNTQGNNLATVFVDGQAYGSVDALRNIPAYQVGAIEYFDVTQAGARFGLRAGGTGAIEVRLRTP
jgi:hypothetical protein